MQRFAARIPSVISDLHSVQRDAGTDPGFVFVEIDAHHFALAHPDQVVHQDRIAVILGPDKHHSNLRF